MLIKPVKTSKISKAAIANISFIVCLTIKPTNNPMINGIMTGTIQAISGGVANFL